TTTTADYTSTLTISGDPITDGSFYQESYTFSYAFGSASYTLSVTTTSTETSFTLTMSRSDNASGSETVAVAPPGDTGSLTWQWTNTDFFSRTISNTSYLHNGEVSGGAWSDSGNGSGSYHASGDGSYSGGGAGLPAGMSESVSGSQSGHDDAW